MTLKTVRCLSYMYRKMYKKYRKKVVCHSYVVNTMATKQQQNFNNPMCNYYIIIIRQQ